MRYIIMFRELHKPKSKPFLCQGFRTKAMAKLSLYLCEKENWRPAEIQYFIWDSETGLDVS